MKHQNRESIKSKSKAACHLYGQRKTWAKVKILWSRCNIKYLGGSNRKHIEQLGVNFESPGDAVASPCLYVAPPLSVYESF